MKKKKRVALVRVGDEGKRVALVRGGMKKKKRVALVWVGDEEEEKSGFSVGRRGFVPTEVGAPAGGGRSELGRPSIDPEAAPDLPDSPGRFRSGSTGGGPDPTDPFPAGEFRSIDRDDRA